MKGRRQSADSLLRAFMEKEGVILENESQSSELGGAGFDALPDYYGDELPQEGPAEGAVPSESPSYADSPHQEDESSSGPYGEGGGAGPDGEAKGSGTEEAESSDSGGRSGGGGSETGSASGGSSGEEGESEIGSDAGGRVVEGEGEEASGEESSERESPEGESSERESSERESFGGGASGDGASGGGASGGDSSGEGSSMRESFSGTQEPAEFEGREEYTEPFTGETLMPQEELFQIHSDLQFISCFMVIFLVIIMCHYAYRFFKIFI